MRRGRVSLKATQSRVLKAHCKTSYASPITFSLPKEMVAREKCGTIAMVVRKDGEMTGKVSPQIGW